MQNYSALMYSNSCSIKRSKKLTRIKSCKKAYHEVSGHPSLSCRLPISRAKRLICVVNQLNYAQVMANKFTSGWPDCQSEGFLPNRLQRGIGRKRLPEFGEWSTKKGMWCYGIGLTYYSGE